MRITLIQHGKTKDKFIQEGVALFRKRVERYVPFKEETLPDLKSSKHLTIQDVMVREGEQLLRRIKGGDYLVLLDEKGREFNSIGFAEHLNRLQGRVSHMVIVIGGPYGFSREVYARANEKVALSQMTFSHQLVRLLFMEQLYRAFTILKGEPYHHA